MMSKRKKPKKVASKSLKAKRPQKGDKRSVTAYTEIKDFRAGFVVGERPLAQLRSEKLKSFRVTRGGRQKDYSILPGYGYLVPSLLKAKNLMEVAELVEKGIPSKDIEPVIEFLDFKVPDIAKAAAVSSSTVLRWEPETSIGVPGSGQFFRIDEVIRKGVDLFGGEEEFKGWLNSPNMALGNAIPVKLIISLIGVEMVDEALDALHYGNVM